MLLPGRFSARTQTPRSDSNHARLGAFTSTCWWSMPGVGPRSSSSTSRIGSKAPYLASASTCPRQGAHDISRHDACKDIWRLETMIANGFADAGAAIVLTNDGGYWRRGTKDAPIDACFRLHEGRTVEGTLEWAPHAGAGTTRSRLDPLPLRGIYPCRWAPYSQLDQAGGRRIEFRYLHHSVGA